MTQMTLSQFLRRIGSPISVKALEEKLTKNEIFSVVGNIGSELATEITEMEKRFQRPLNRGHVLKLHREMLKGQFETSASIVIGLVKDGSTAFGDLLIHLQDGQHRMAALAETTMWFGMNIVFRFYDSVDEMLKASLRIDAHSKRTGRDQGQIMELDLGPLATQEDLKLVTPAIDKMIRTNLVKSFTGNLTRSDISGDNRLAAVEKFKVQFQEFFNTIHTGSRFYDERLTSVRNGRIDDLRKVPIVAMGVATFADNPRLAEQFWGSYVRNSAKSGDAMEALAEYFMRNAHHNPKEKGTGGNDQRRQMMAIQIAWEYKKQGKSLRFQNLYNQVQKRMDSDNQVDHLVGVC